MAHGNDTANGVEVHDASDLRKYRTEIPNLILEMGLTPYQLALYIHLKRTAGNDGMCWKAVRRIAEESNISRSEISRARKVLQEKGLIKIHQPKDPTKATEVTIVDIWAKNMAHFAHVSLHGTRRGSSEGHRKEPLEEGVEANASTGIANDADSRNVVAESKYVTDLIYTAMEQAGYALDNADFKYQLGRAQHMLDKLSPTASEREAIGSSCVKHFEIYGKTDAMAGLRYARQQAARTERIEADRESIAEGEHEPSYYEKRYDQKATEADEEHHRKVSELIQGAMEEWKEKP